MFELKKVIDTLLRHHPEQTENINVYGQYLYKLMTEKDKKKGGLKNPWINYKTENDMIAYFKKVMIDGLSIDGVHITIQNTGISYDYIAFKNKMYLIYPESLIDVQLVFEEDKFSFKKESGRVLYVHQITDPFNQKNIKGAYCIIKNKRGEFLTLLSKDEIDKHKKTAKTSFIWNNWFNEMALKTIIKKACKQHFADIFQNIENIDNENYNLDNLKNEQPQRTASITPPISINEDKVNNIFSLIQKLNFPTKDLLEYLFKKFNRPFKNISDLNNDEYSIVEKILKNKVKKL